MKRNFSFTLLFFFCAGVSFGQGYTFKVLANKGDNKVKSGADWQPLKTGASLQDTDELILSENPYLGLVHSTGKTIELKVAGTHKVSDLAEKVGSGNSSVTSKYADFVLSKMSAEGKKNRLSATGAVHRGSNDAITVYIPSSAGVLNDDAIIRWDSLQGENNAYIVKLNNMFGDELLSVETNKPILQLDLKSEQLAKENVVLLSVSSKNDESVKSSTHAIKRLPQSDAEKVKASLEELMADVNNETALNNYILAGFYEENDLLVDALTSYERAIVLAPEVESYQEAYQEFLLRNRLKE